MYARFGSGDDRIEPALRLLAKAARYGRHLKWSALGAALATLVATATRLVGPLLIRSGVDDGIVAGDRSKVLSAGVAFLGVLVVQYISQAVSQYWVAAVGERFLRDLRVKAFDRLMRLDINFFGKNKSGVLVARMTSDIEALTQFVKEGAVNVVTSALTVTGVLVAMFFVDLKLALAVLGLFPFLLLASVVFRVFADRAYAQVREHIGHVLGAIQEGISGVRVVQAYTQERRKAVEFGRANEDYFRANVLAAKAISVYFPTVDFLRTAGGALVLFVGGSRVLDGEMTLGVLFAFLLYLNWFFEPIVQLSNVYNLLQAALAALAKLFGILDQEPGLPPPVDPDPLRDVARSLEFRDVMFGYDPNVPIVEGFNLRIAPGERVAVVGETGAGKSTIAKLAVRFYDPDQGTIEFSGVDLRAISESDIRHHIVLVPQEGFLFSGTLRDNIQYGQRDASDEEIRRVCASVGIAEWVDSLENGLNTEVRERGSRLSSGERQLVALARALLADPSLIVLDEATSNLDPETEGRVDVALSTLLEGRTAIVIAHRLATAERADRVVVVADGAIVEMGTHSELLARGGRYTDLQRVWTGMK